MSKVLHCRFFSTLSIVLALLMAWTSIALAAPDSGKAPAKSIVISDRPGEYKIGLGKAEGAEVGAKGVISRSGKDIAQFEITSVEWGYSRISVSDVKSNMSIRINDTVKVTETPKPTGEQKIKKKDGALKVLGGLLLVGALIALGGSGGGKGGGGTSGGGGSVGDITLSATNTSLPADGTSTSTITATVVDSHNAAVSDGTVVRFSATLGAINPREATTVGGVATATLTAGATQGLCVVTATAGGKTESVTISFLPTAEGQPGSIQLIADPTSIQVLGSTGGVTESTITATCRDAQGNLATSGTVTLSSNIGSINGSAPINASGVATATFSSNKTGQSRITATWEGATATTNVMVTSGPPYTVTALCTPGSIQNDGHSFASVAATVKDISGNPVTDGTVVQFAVQPDVTGGGNGTITPEARTSNGVAQAILLSRDASGDIALSGTATVVVTVPVAQPTGIPAPAVELQNNRTQVQFTSLDAAFITLGANPLNIRGLDYVNRTTTVTAMVYDSSRNPVPDNTAVYFTTDHGMIYGNSGTVGGVALSVTRLGIATATIASDAPCPGLPCGFNGFVTVTATSGPVTGQCGVIFSGWPSPGNCSADMSPTSLAACQDSAIIIVTAFDINGNPVVDGTVVKLSTTKGTLSESSPATAGGAVQVTLSTSSNCTNPTASGPGQVKIAIESGGRNPETGDQPIRMILDFTIL